MADVSGQSVLNEAALKRLDPYVNKVIDTAKFVALYTFKLKENKWEKTGVEGSLFVYSRTGEPFYNILVLNRLNTNNLIEPISSKLTLQLHEPFLLYLNSKCCLYGMWFYEKEECTRLAALIERLIKEPMDTKQSSKNIEPVNGSAIDICNMLTRAQEAYNSSKSNGAELEDVRRLTDMEQTPQSVVDFFAKAGSAPKKTGISASLQGISPGRSQSLPVNGIKGPVNPLIHQLMSNPIHLVEHIEKQQRMVIPKPSEIPNTSILKNIMKQSEQRNESQECCRKCEKRENGVNCPQVSPIIFLKSVPEETSCEVSPDRKLMEMPKTPALMPPAMFTPQSLKGSPELEDDFKLEPLTRNQLFQAINYLLRNDPVFMTKIHEAYVKSLTDKVL